MKKNMIAMKNTEPKKNDNGKLIDNIVTISKSEDETGYIVTFLIYYPSSTWLYKVDFISEYNYNMWLKNRYLQENFGRKSAYIKAHAFEAHKVDDFERDESKIQSDLMMFLMDALLS